MTGAPSATARKGRAIAGGPAPGCPEAILAHRTLAGAIAGGPAPGCPDAILAHRTLAGAIATGPVPGSWPGSRS